MLAVTELFSSEESILILSLSCVGCCCQLRALFAGNNYCLHMRTCTSIMWVRLMTACIHIYMIALHVYRCLPPQHNGYFSGMLRICFPPSQGRSGRIYTVYLHSYTHGLLRKAIGLLVLSQSYHYLLAVIHTLFYYVQANQIRILVVLVNG